jgi:hypothetical protein
MGALVINATFDSSITGDPNAAAIEAMINNAMTIYESLFNDPITVSILFRYATTQPNGSPLPAGAGAVSNKTTYMVPWSTYISGLTADATTTNDATANASLPGSALSTNILPSSADGRAVSLNTPPALFADGSIGAGGPYDGIVTLNSSAPFDFTRPPSAGMIDAQLATKHEMDEVLGLGSFIGLATDLRPQDLFSWSAPGTRNLTSSGSRYFSIDGGTTDIVGFNQTPPGDFGDWLSGSCPQTPPYVQNAFGCADQVADVTQASPEGINLDVIGYDLINPPPAFACASTPVSGCHEASVGGSSLSLKNSTDDTKDKLNWKWRGDDMLGLSTSPDRAICIYAPGPVAQVTISGSSGWVSKGIEIKYANRTGTVGGITKITMKPSSMPGKAKVQVKGAGTNLPDPSMPLTLPATVQLQSSDGECWEHVFVGPAKKNDMGEFSDKE